MGKRFESRKGSVLGCIEDFNSVIEGLKDEIEEWRDNMPENLQGGNLYSRLDDTANALEAACDATTNAVEELSGIAKPEEWPEGMAWPPDVEVTFGQDERKSARSRSARLSNAIAQAEAACDYLEAWEAPTPGDEPSTSDGEPRDVEEWMEPVQSAIEGSRERLREAIDECGNCEFPGMRG
jgi:hypothetical protein